MKKVKLNSVNSLYLIIGKMNGYFEEINGNKYLMLVPTNESKEITKKATNKQTNKKKKWKQLWTKI